MAYCELHGSIRHHYKTNRLMARLKISRREAVGIVCTLASWAIENRPGGLVPLALIPDAIEWDRDRKELTDALIDREAVKEGLSGWLDEMKNGTVKIHDWEEFTKNFRKSKSDYQKRAEALQIDKGHNPPAKEVLAGALGEQGKTETETDYHPEGPVNPDRASTPELMLTDAYLRWNPDLHKRSFVHAKIQAAKKAGADLQKIEVAVNDQAKCENVEIWKLLNEFIPEEKFKFKPRVDTAEAIRLANELIEKNKRAAEERRKVAK